MASGSVLADYYTAKQMSLAGLVAGFAEGAASTGDAPTVPHAVVQFVPEFESTLFKKPCNRSLNPAGTSKMRSSPVMTSIFRVLS